MAEIDWTDSSAISHVISTVICYLIKSCFEWLGLRDQASEGSDWVCHSHAPAYWTAIRWTGKILISFCCGNDCMQFIIIIITIASTN